MNYSVHLNSSSICTLRIQAVAISTRFTTTSTYRCTLLMSSFTKFIATVVPRSTLFAPQIPPLCLRYDFKPINTSVRSHSRHRLLVPASHRRPGTMLRYATQVGFTRSFSATSNTQTRRIGGYILKVSLTGMATYFSWLVATLVFEYWHK